MAGKVWIPIDVYFLSNGFPLTSERIDMVEVRLKKMGYELKDTDSFKEIHERLIDKFYGHKDKVHIIKAKRRYKGKS